jgi:hypothetical protein
MNREPLKIVHEGAGGHVECEHWRFDFQPMGQGAFAIYFPRRRYDRKLARIRARLQELVTENPLQWEVLGYDSPHGFYRGLTAKQRLALAEVTKEYQEAIREGDDRLAKAILMDVDLSADEADAAIEEDRRNPRHD